MVKTGDDTYEYAFNTYGILVKKVGVCQSYAYAYKLLCNLAGVECNVVTGYLDGNLPHAWNAVKIDDAWYETEESTVEETKEKKSKKFSMSGGSSNSLDDFVLIFDDCDIESGFLGYQDAKTDEEKFDVFCDLMRQDSDNTVEKIYVYATKDFAEENLLPDEDMSALLTNLQNAKAVSDTPSGDVTHYMAVSTDGTIVKFSVYGEKYVSINDIGTIYSF